MLAKGALLQERQEERGRGMFEKIVFFVWFSAHFFVPLSMNKTTKI